MEVGIFITIDNIHIVVRVMGETIDTVQFGLILRLRCLLLLRRCLGGGYDILLIHTIVDSSTIHVWIGCVSFRLLLRLGRQLRLQVLVVVVVVIVAERKK